MPVHVKAVSYRYTSVLATAHVFIIAYCLNLSDLKRVPIKTEIIRACLFKYRCMTTTGNSCNMYLCPVVKKKTEGVGLRGSISGLSIIS